MVCEQEWAGSRLTVRTYGILSQPELIQGVREITSDARYDDVRQVVIDFLHIEKPNDSLLEAVEDLLVIMIGAAASNPNVRVAVIASNAHIADLVSALNAVTQAHPPALACFPEHDPAAEWLAEAPRRPFPSIRFRPR